MIVASDYSRSENVAYAHTKTDPGHAGFDSRNGSGWKRKNFRGNQNGFLFSTPISKF